MGRLKNTLVEIRLNKNIKRWRKIELEKKYRKVEQNIIANACLTNHEKTSIDNYFIKNTRKKVDYFWHLKYKIVSGQFHPNYFPEIYYNADLKHRFNDKNYIQVYSNKFVLSQIINGANIGVATPKNIVSCNNGILLNENNQSITIEEAVSLIIKADKVFCKKSIGTYGGQDCELISSPTDTTIRKFLNNYGQNYLIQRVISNQEDLKKLNPSTLNTFRIITFYASGKFRTSPLILRIGRKNQHLDNAHAGGMFVGVNDEGVIVTDAKNVAGETFVKHPDTNITFKGYTIKNVSKLIEKATELAGLLPQTKLIDWDLTIDEQGDIVCIEANIDSGSIWLMQMTHGKPVFGEYTEEMLKYVHLDSIFKIIKNNL